MKNKKTLLSFITIIMLLLSACGAGEQASSSGGSDEEKGLKKVVLRLKWIHQAQFAGFYAAKEKGYYEEAGLDVEIRPGGADFPSVQMVASGDEDFGVTGADQILLAREKGVPVQALSVIYRESPFALFSLKDSGVETIEDLVGETVGVKLGGNEELTYRAMVENSGIDGESIEEMPVKYDLSPLLSGQVKAWPGYVINEVIAAQEEGYEVNVIQPKDYDINFYADTLFAKEDLIKEDPDLVKNFVEASMKGWQYAIDHPEEAAEFGLEYSEDLKLDHEISMMKASVPLLQPEKSPLGKMDESEWNYLQENLLNLGFLKEEQNINDVFTNDFIK
ncbi:ABC transporter substrate-binding protein [Metabacillus litoralis]|uniref:ABC transporter substrate-binding protein n=1 Tax=Metabacillus litoralis TaxID=152268 RepID=UPI001B9F021A|nr:ABC transporter substrate-binding protein [Metabacillus litoralis]UHA61373.1 ABC transporter substrate-binding protein [Metabacillus litoralis]